METSKTVKTITDGMGQYYQGLGESELGPGDHKHLPPHSVSADAFFVARLMWKGKFLFNILSDL